jgi:3-oxoacyl-[acyl-carrier protein] reductase
MNRELHHLGIKSCAICPGFVDTQMSDYIKEQVPAEEMIRTSDVAEMFRALLKLSQWCVVPEIVLSRPGDLGFP